jgi:hypothetical protein
MSFKTITLLLRRRKVIIVVQAMFSTSINALEQHKKKALTISQQEC